MPDETIHDTIEKLRGELARVLFGQRELIDRLLVGLLTGGHLLLEGVPGLAKTLAVRALGQAVGARFGRVQFTPDLLPADLVGTEIYSPATGTFSVRKGPIFTQILLVDEINRAPAKVQSALLEAMQEKQVTIGLETLPLPVPFLVLATQNPIEQEGTYPLPEAQVDRFLMKVRVDYPSRDEERRIVASLACTACDQKVTAVLTPEQLLCLREQVDGVHMDEKILDYILDVVRATRTPSEFGLDLDRLIELGASPRGAIGLALAGKGVALVNGRDYVVPHDIKSIGPDVLRHRILPSFEAESEGVTTDRILETVFAELAVP